MKRHRAIRLAATAAVAVVAAACVPVTAPPPQQTPPTPKPPPAPLLTRSNVVTNLNKPWDIAFVPDATAIAGKMLYTENDAGTVSLYVGPTEQRRVLVNLPGINTAGEGGAMGIAVDPDFATNKYVYVCYTTATDNRVARFVATLDPSELMQTLTFDTDIVDGMLNAGFHNGCRIRFDPATVAGGNPALFITMGDAGVATSPQDPNGLNGKVLRVDRNGAMYTGNLSGKLWYTMGHRNPQGIAFRPADGVPYSAEHGPNVDDEINRLVDGGNAGWNPSTNIMTDHVNFPDAFDPVWASGSRTIAISGIDFLSGAAWAAWQGNIVGAMLKDMELRMWKIGSSGGVTGTVRLFSDGATRLRVPVIGPDGALYVATDMPSPTGAIWKFTRN